MMTMNQTRAHLFVIVSMIPLAACLISAILAAYADQGNVEQRSLWWSDDQLYLAAQPTLEKKGSSLPVALRPLFFEKIPVNQANQVELQFLDGIGPVLAERLVRHRTKNGAFATINDLIKVKGIGPKRAASLLPVISFDE